jgi:hypothetical protein
LGIADPDNQPITGNAEEAFASSRTDPIAGDDVLVGLAFSGGGTRAAAFAHGVLSEIDQTTVRTRTGTHSLLDSVGFVSGVSGGAVTAAYYGLKKRAALADFRERFLIRNAAAGLNTNLDPLSLVKALGGSVATSRFSRAGSTKTFSTATFASFRKTPARGSGSTPPTFTTRRSSTAGRLSSRCAATAATYPIADAVAASPQFDRCPSGQDLYGLHKPSRRNGLRRRATIPTPRRCSRPLPTRCLATTATKYVKARRRPVDRLGFIRLHHLAAGTDIA